MSGLGSLFLRHASGSEAAERALQANEFAAECDICRKVTIWRFVTNAIGQQLYKCLSCGKAWDGRQ